MQKVRSGCTCAASRSANPFSSLAVFEEPEDPTNRSFFSEIISSISGIKFSNSGRYLISRDYLSVKVWDLNMDTRPVETYEVHEYLRAKLCSLYENDFIFDKFECCFNGNDQYMMTGSYNNFFKIINRHDKRDVMLEASKDIAKPKTILKPRKVCSSPLPQSFIPFSPPLNSDLSRCVPEAKRKRTKLTWKVWTTIGRFCIQHGIHPKT